MGALQRRFLDLRFGMYIHLNMATYEEREWGNPKASPTIFDPGGLDTDQWARAALSAKMRYACLTTKHHDGFCLWPTATKSPSVMQSSYRHDIVRAYVDSFRRHGLKVCLYFSILDLRANVRHFDVTPEKIAMIRQQLTELLTGYGPITALIIDGWNAGWSRINYSEVPFTSIYEHVKSLQPDCLLTDYNAGRYPAPILYYSDIKQYEEHAGQTSPPGSMVPSQAANTLQSVWFWKKSFPTEKLRPASQVVSEWLAPFNRNYCNFILNVAPNREGRFDANAVERLEEIGKLWDDAEPLQKVQPSLVITTPNLAAGHPSYASSSADTTGPDLANDDRPATYWLADDGQTSGWIEIDLEKQTFFNTIVVAEPTYLDDYGTQSRIAKHRVEAWAGGSWTMVLSGGAIESGVSRVAGVRASRVRLSIEGGPKPPGIAEFGVYAQPDAG